MWLLVVVLLLVLVVVALCIAVPPSYVKDRDRDTGPLRRELASSSDNLSFYRDTEQWVAVPCRQKRSEGLINGFLTQGGVGFTEELSEAGLWSVRDYCMNPKGTSALEWVFNDPEVLCTRKANQIVSPTSLRQVGKAYSLVKLVR